MVSKNYKDNFLGVKFFFGLKTLLSNFIK